MITIINKNEIITRYRNGEGIRPIAKAMGISRNTVRDYVREYRQLELQLQQEKDQARIALIQQQICSSPKRKESKHKRLAFTPEVEKRFLELIKIDEERDKLLGQNKQYISAAKLCRVLNSEGFKVSESTILFEYNKYKKKYRECYIKQWYEYGQRAEYDFHQIKVVIAGKVETFHQATISLPKSNYIFGLLYKNENIQTVMDSIIKFISHCGGVFNEMVFDNMSTVVKRLIVKGEKEYTDDIIKLSTYYGFKITTCNVRSGNEKGHVENSGKLIRKELFSLNYEFDSEEALYAYYEQELSNYNKDVLNAFNEEKKALKPKPLHDYLLCEFSTGTVNSYSLISVDNNFYSVPDKYVGEEVIINKFSDSIIVYYKQFMICEHIKKEGFKDYSIDINHYINTLLRKPGAIKNSLALKQAPKELQTLFYKDYNMDGKKFIEDLMKNQLKIHSIIKDETSINEVSTDQLNEISLLFGQGDNDERNRTISS